MLEENNSEYSMFCNERSIKYSLCLTRSKRTFYIDVELSSHVNSLLSNQLNLQLNEHDNAR